MKRSEMLNKITDIIHNYRRATEVVTSEQLSHMLLEMQEAYGMQPPVYYDVIYDDPPECDGYINEWEKE